MLKEGLFADFKPEAAFGLHVLPPAVQVGQIRRGARRPVDGQASDRFNIKVIGRQTHGSGARERHRPDRRHAPTSISAAQAVVSRQANIAKQPAVVGFGAIKGGIRYNIIPDQVEMVGTIRTFDEGMRQKIFADLKNVAEHTAAAHGAAPRPRCRTRTATPPRSTTRR